MFLRVLLLPLCLYSSLLPIVSASEKLETIFEWKFIDYLWNNEEDRRAAIKSGEYNYTKPVIIDVEVWKNGKIFVTAIRGDGVPASLMTISNKFGEGGPLLKPYPDWSWTKKGDCNGITNVYRVAIDECDILWVLDTGSIDHKQICPAQLLVFDLHTDRLIKRIKIPNDISQNSKTKEGLLVTPMIQTEGRYCERTHVYMADVVGHALVVYNGTSLWRLESPVYGPQASAADIEIAGESFHLPDGILGMALSSRRMKESRFLMFRSLASYDMVSAETSNLQNSYGNTPVAYTVTSRILPSQAVAMAFSSENIIFFGLTKETALACWNMEKPMTKENIVMVDQNRNTHQFASGIKVIPSRLTGRTEEIWMATNRLQKIFQGTQNFNEINFRIMAGSVEKLVARTKCACRQKFKDNYQWNYDNSYGNDNGYQEPYKYFW